MKWFQVDSNTPSDPKIARIVREFGNAGFGALVRLWCFVAEHGAEAGHGIDGSGRPYDLDDLAHAVGAKKENVERLINACAEVGHVDAAAWSQRRCLVFPAMAKRADEYTQKLKRNPELHLDKRVYAGGPRRREVFDACNWTCQYCGKRSPDGRDLEVDHRIPKAAGGLDESGNLTAACRSCNRKKGERQIPELFVGVESDGSGTTSDGSGADSKRSAYSTGQNSTSEDSTGENTRPTRAELVTWFTDQFWPNYPNKVSKQDAVTAIDKLKPTRAMLNDILAGLARWKTSRAWVKDNGDFIPHPATWLNGRRFDDYPTQYVEARKPTPPPTSGRTGAAPAGKYAGVMRRDSEVH